MRTRSRNLESLLIVAFMLLSVVALNLPNSQSASATTVVADFCADCAQQCWNDANTGENNAAYWECVDEKGDTPENRNACYNTVVIGYYNSCIALFCNSNGCKVTRKMPRSGPGDN